MSEARERLKKISNMVKPLLEKEGFSTVNEAIIEKIYKEGGEHSEFKTFNQWESMGYKIKKGSKAFAVWAKPTQAQRVKNDEADVFDWFPICFLFSDKQVELIERE